MQKLIRALQARKLDRVAAAYAVTGGLVVQGANNTLPILGAPQWALRILIVIILIGFPLTVSIAWMITPQPRPRKSGEYATTTRTDRALLTLLGVVIVISTAQFTYEIWHQSTVSRSRNAASENVEPIQASIAVLPFVNMSGDPSKEYFSDGISEELLNDLTNKPGLRVAARTSAFAFKGKSEDIQEIARTLHVRTVLEGSVRESGNHIRITAQLINAANGYHLWSATFDRELTDILIVQDDIARNIARELTGRLLAREVADTSAPVIPKINPHAYSAYLQGRFLMNKRDSGAMQRASDFFKQAIALEPNYADAHASLGMTYALLYGNGQRRDTLQPAKDEIAATLRLAPNNFTALLARAWVAEFTWNLAEADAAMQELMKRYPNSAEVHHVYATVLMRLGIFDTALTEERRATALDPLALVNRINVGEDLRFLGKEEEAITEYKQVLALDPNFVFALSDICVAYADTGKLDVAKEVLRPRLVAVDGESGFYTTYCKSVIAYHRHDSRELKELAQAMERLYNKGNGSAAVVAYQYAFAGDNDAATRWFEKAYADHDFTFVGFNTDPEIPVALKNDPRWQALMQRQVFQECARVRAEVIARSTGG